MTMFDLLLPTYSMPCQPWAKLGYILRTQMQTLVVSTLSHLLTTLYGLEHEANKVNLSVNLSG